MCPFPPPEPPQPPNRIRQRSNSPSACQKVIRRQPNSGGSSQFQDRKSTRLNSSHGYISYAVFGLKKKLVRHVNQIKALQETVITLTVQFEEYPRVPRAQRAELTRLPQDFWHVTVRFGFVYMPTVV